VLIESIDEYAEGKITLKLSRAARQHELPATLSERAELTQQTRLADPRLTRHSQGARGTPGDRIKRIAHRPKLGDTPHKYRRETGKAGRHGWRTHDQAGRSVNSQD
jgi:hypothetical protein